LADDGPDDREGDREAEERDTGDEQAEDGDGRDDPDRHGGGGSTG
jgi:hypothetical protein